MATKAKQWKGKSQRKAQDLTLPSGNEAVIRRVPMESLLSSGVIPNSLIEIITSQLSKNGGDKPMTEAEKEKLMASQLESIKEDPTRLADLVKMTDNVCLAIVIEPAVHPVPEDEKERDEDLLYVDEVTMEDKMFMFSVAVGGNEDLEQFRESVRSDVDAGEDSKKPVKATKRTSTRKG